MTDGSKTQYGNIGALSIQPMSVYEIKKMMAEAPITFGPEQVMASFIHSCKTS